MTPPAGWRVATMQKLQDVEAAIRLAVAHGLCDSSVSCCDASSNSADFGFPSHKGEITSLNTACNHIK